MQVDRVDLDQVDLDRLPPDLRELALAERAARGARELRDEAELFAARQAAAQSRSRLIGGSEAPAAARRRSKAQRRARLRAKAAKRARKRQRRR